MLKVKKNYYLIYNRNKFLNDLIGGCSFIRLEKCRDISTNTDVFCNYLIYIVQTPNEASACLSKVRYIQYAPCKWYKRK